MKISSNFKRIFFLIVLDIGLELVSFPYMLAQFSFLWDLPDFPPRILSTSGIRVVGLRLGRVQF